MIATAIYNKEDTGVFEKALMNYRPGEDGYKPIKELQNYLSLKQPESAEADLKYPRYWHGYLLFLKPALMFFNYSDIRMINTFCQFAIIGLILWQFCKRNMAKIAVGFCIAMAYVMPIATSQSLQYSTSFYVCIIAVLIMLRFHEKLVQNHGYLYFFLIVGMLTSFFDLLTFPLITLGIPMVLLMILNDKKTIQEKIGHIIVYSIIWAIGFVGLWASKWIISSLIMQSDYVSEAIKEITKRTSSEGKNGEVITTGLALKKNFDVYKKRSYELLLGIAFISNIYMIIRYHEKPKHMILHAIPFLLICIMPIAWYIVTANHSGIHYWFTSKNIAILMFSLFGMLAMMYKKEMRLKTDEFHKKNKKI